MAILIQCPRCKKNWVDEDRETVCIDCREPLTIDMAVFGVHEAMRAVDKLDFNKFTKQHRIILSRAKDHLEAIINVLERYPTRE